jgi:RES domain-containing protein
LILSTLSGGVTLYRCHDPKWAISPISGAGAARVGGRFNRKAIEALYLSFESKTALSEYRQTSELLPPCTICSYKANIDTPLVDLRKLHRGQPWDDLWQDWAEDWRHALFDLHTEPASWVLSDLVRDAKHCGIIFPSAIEATGLNLVIYPDLISATSRLEVFDPLHQLPKDQSSW